MPTPAERQELAIRLPKYKHDPLGYVKFIFPWGHSELKNSTGPRRWQRRFLKRLGERLRAGKITAAQVIQEAISSGHGIGKSALVAWLIKWAMATKVDTRGIVTANTENQLLTKTWPELEKWHRLAIDHDWFTCAATAFYSNDPGHKKTWRIDIIPWSLENTEAFAGLHNKGKRIILIFDEASAIPDLIWQVSEGALTDEETEILWFVFGNPTRRTGRFRECFRSLKHRWGDPQEIDAREVEGTNKTQIQQWAEDYGEESDFFRVRVTGKITDNVEAAVFRNIVECATVTAFEQPVRSKFYRIGVDLGRYLDFTVFTVMDRERRVVYMERFKDTHWEVQKLRMLELSLKWTTDQGRPEFWVDATHGSVGDVIAGDCEKSGINVQKYCFTSGRNGARWALIENLIIQFERKRISILSPNVFPAAIDELAAYEYSLTESKNLTHGAPEGEHDDCVFSIALAAWGWKDAPLASPPRHLPQPVKFLSRGAV